MRRKKIFYIILFICTLLAIFIFSKEVKKNRISNNDNNQLIESNEYENKIKQIIKIEESNEYNDVNITIKTDDGISENITDKDIEIVKVLNDNKENAEQIAIKNKVFSIEAKKRNISLSDEDVKLIDDIINSDEISQLFSNANNYKQNNFKEDINKYMTDMKLKYELEDEIDKEIFNDKLSIENSEIEKKMNEFLEIKNSFESIKNPTDEERENYFEKLSNCYNDIKSLYEEHIMNQYTIEKNYEQNK